MVHLAWTICRCATCHWAGIRHVRNLRRMLGVLSGLRVLGIFLKSGRLPFADVTTWSTLTLANHVEIDQASLANCSLRLARSHRRTAPCQHQPRGAKTKAPNFPLAPSSSVATQLLAHPELEVLLRPMLTGTLRGTFEATVSLPLREKDQLGDAAGPSPSKSLLRIPTSLKRAGSPYRYNLPVFLIGDICRHWRRESPVDW